jgi:uncharacterized protein YggE
MEEGLLKGDDGKRFFKWGSWAFVVLMVFLAVQTLSAFKGLSNTDPAYNAISVVGEGEVVAVPDIASFSFSVSADASKVDVAQTEVTKKMNAILLALKESGIEERDIKTTDYSVWPRYRYSEEPVVCSSTYCPPSRGQQIADGYTASHNISVKVRDTESAGKVLGLVGERGATNISGISFTTDDPDKLMDEARALAIADAKAKAKTLSRQLGVRLVRVVSYSDNMDYPMPFYRSGMEADMMVKTQASAPTLPTGENKTVVSVTVTYEIR